MMMMGGMQQSQSPIAKVLTRTLTVTLPPIGYNPNPNLNLTMKDLAMADPYGGTHATAVDLLSANNI